MKPRPGDRIRVRFLRGKRFIVKEVAGGSIVHAFEDSDRLRLKLRTFLAADVEVVKAEAS